MLRLALLALLVGVVVSQIPAPCFTPLEMTMRANEYDHLDDRINRWFIAYDAANKRRSLIEEQDVILPGRQFRQYIEIGQESLVYEINLTLKTCSKVAMRRPWRPYAIPVNATFETEYSVGGPGESFNAQEWSDRIPLRSREYWIGVFTLQNCYPVREVIIADYEQVNSTITTNYYDIVAGITNPDDFIPPEYCSQAKWMPRTARKLPFF